MILLSSAPAWAGPGDHIRPSEGVVIAPSIAVGAEFRTNVYRGDEGAVPAANSMVMPGLSIQAQGPDHEFMLGGEALIRTLFFVGDSEELSNIERPDRLSRLNRNDFNITAGAELFKRSAVGLVVEDRMVLRNNEIDAEYAEAPFTTQFRNRLGGGLKIKPSSALSLTPGVQWTYDDFRVAGGGDRRYNQRHSIGPELAARWDFFPRTALVFNGSYRWFNWQDNEVVSPGAEVGVPDSRHARVTVGAEGRLTRKLGVTVGVGYGTASYDSVDLPGEAPAFSSQTGDPSADLKGLDGLLANAQLQYFASESSELFIGYQRDFLDSFFTNFLRYDYVYAGATASVGVLEPSVRYGLRFEEYVGGVERQDQLHRLNLDLRYNANPWLGIAGGAMMQSRLSDDSQVEYEDWRMHLMAQFTY